MQAHVFIAPATPDCGPVPKGRQFDAFALAVNLMRKITNHRFSLQYWRRSLQQFCNDLVVFEVLGFKAEPFQRSRQPQRQTGLEAMICASASFYEYPRSPVLP